jgi:hypothetical protein
MDTKKVGRRHDLDWLTVIGIGSVFLYHSMRFFDSENWHIKNAVSSPLVDGVKSILDLWQMGLLFMLSGASIYLALRPGGAVRFIKDRVKRLLVPLGFGILVLGPPQIYLDRVFHGEFQGGFLEFLPLYFQDWRIWNGNFAWSGVHLWYLEDLFLFMLVLLPLFLALKSAAGRRFTERLSRVSALPGGIYLWALPFALFLIAFDPLGIMGNEPPEDIVRLIVYSPVLIFGFLLISAQAAQGAVIRQRRLSLALALVMTLAVPVVAGWAEEGPTYLGYVLIMLLVSMLSWCSLLAIFGYGMRYLNVDRPWLSRAREAVLPFYILHQPVILILGSFIIPLPLSIAAKWLLITPAAFAISIGLYEYAVRRWNPLRWAFGLKPLKPVAPAVELAAQPSS